MSDESKQQDTEPPTSLLEKSTFIQTQTENIKQYLSSINDAGKLKSLVLQLVDKQIHTQQPEQQNDYANEIALEVQEFVTTALQNLGQTSTQNQAGESSVKEAVSVRSPSQPQRSNLFETLNFPTNSERFSTRISEDKFNQTVKKVESLENQLSFQRAKCLNLQNQMKSERENINKQATLLQFQKNHLINEATKQQQQQILKLSKELNDKNDILNFYIRKNQEQEKMILELTNLLKKTQEQIKKVKSKQKQKQNKTKKITKQISPVPRPLSAIGSPKNLNVENIQKKEASEPELDDNDWSTDSEFMLEKELTEIENTILSKQNASFIAQVEQAKQLHKAKALEDLFCIEITNCELAQEKLIDIIQQSIKMPYNFMIQQIEHESNVYKLFTVTKAACIYLYQLLRIEFELQQLCIYYKDEIMINRLEILQTDVDQREKIETLLRDQDNILAVISDDNQQLQEYNFIVIVLKYIDAKKLLKLLKANNITCANVTQ